jgi:hypothetical protein
VRPKRSGLAAALLFLFLALSTSGTAYAGMALYGLILSYSILRRAARGQSVSRLGIVLSLSMFVLALVGTVLMFESSLLSRLIDFFDVAVVGKLDSDSGEERGAWNAHGLENFLDSYGLGLGFGTMRTSSFAVTLLANVGIVGTVTYGLFLWHVLRSKSARPYEAESNLIRASRHAVLGSLCASCVSATVFDLGVGFYLFAAAASLPALSQPQAAMVPQSD